MTELRTPRLRLRQWRDADLEPFAALGMTHDPADDLEHPLLPPGHPLRAHVLYRLGRATRSFSGA